MLSIQRGWKRSVLAFVGALGLCAAPAFGGGFELQENGARPLGMANAFTGTSDDPSAAFFNPAGAARQEGLAGMFSVTWVDPHMYLKTDEGAVGAKNQRASSRALFLPAGLGTLGLEITEGLRFGASFWGGAPFGLALDFGRSKEWGGRFSITEASISVVEQNVSVSLEYDLTDTISIAGAAGGSLIYGALTLNRAVDFPTLTGGAIADEGLVRIKMQTGFDDLKFRWNTAGMIRLMRDEDNFKNGRVRLGFSYRDGIHSVRVRGRAKNRIPAAAEAAFQGTVGTRTKLRVRLPGSLRLGVGVDVTKDLTVNFDWRFTNWSVMKTFTLQSEIPGLNNQDLEFEYRDTNYYGLGGEYRVMNWDDDEFGLSVRAGLFYDETPIPRNKIKPLLPDQDRIGFTLGLGFEPIEGLTLDFAYMGFKAATFRNRNVEENTSTSGLGKYTLWTNLIGFTFGLRL